MSDERLGVRDKLAISDERLGMRDKIESKGNE